MLSEKTLLFVYGSLLCGARGTMGAEQRARLRQESKFRGVATLQGRLYDLGSYPGLVLSDRPNEIVHGEVYELRCFQRSIAWLDVFEGVSKPALPGDPYQRLMVDVEVGGVCRAERAWVYESRTITGQMQPIPHGRWLNVQKSRFSLRK